MMHGVVRKGVIPLHSATGDMGYGAYGVRLAGVGWPSWNWRQYKYSQCPGYRKQVDLFVKKKEEYKAKYGTIGWFKGGSQDAANHLRAIEKRGKAEWKKCKAVRKAGKKGWTDISAGGAGMAAGGSALVDPLTGMPMDTSMVSAEVDEGGIGSGVWLALGGLLLVTGTVVAVRKYRKGRKGRRR